MMATRCLRNGSQRRLLVSAQGLYQWSCATRPVLQIRGFKDLGMWTMLKESPSSLQKAKWIPIRSITSSTRLDITGQEALKSTNYIESGVVEEVKNLVGVKKVLVIGSGGMYGKAALYFLTRVHRVDDRTGGRV